MLEKYKDTQTIFYNFVNLSFKNNKIFHAYLIEANDVGYADELVLDFAKFFLCDGEIDKKLIEQIDMGICSNFKIIDAEKEIKKNEVLDLQKEFSLKAVNNGKMVYIINNADRLNKYASNSLLKFLEEPESDIIAILKTNKVNDVLGTIVSRCQVLNLISNDNFDCSNIFRKFYDEVDDFDDFFEKNFDEFIDFYYNYELKGVTVLAAENIYLFNDKMKFLLEFGLYLYFDVFNYMLLGEKNKYIKKNKFVLKTAENN